MALALAQTDLPPPPRSPRYLTLDHWRGVACLLVVLFHSSGVAFLSMEAQGTAPQQEGLAGLALSITRIGWIGVPFFFVISGYAISATADSSRRGRGGPIGYFRRRIRRIYPPFWAMIVLQLLIVAAVDVFLFRGLLTSSIAPIERPWRFDLQQWFGNLTLTESWLYHLPFITSPRDYIIGQSWTLCYEEQFYLVAGAALIFAARRFFTFAAVVTIGVIVLLELAPYAGLRFNGFFFDGYWIAFAMGVLVFWQINYGTSTTAYATWGLLAAGLIYAVTIGPRQGEMERDLAAAAIFGMILFGLHRWDRRMAAWPALRPLKLAGVICYSLYLSHAVIVRTISTGMYAVGFRDPLQTVVIVLPICMVAAIAVGWAFHRAVERHFLNPSSGPSPSGLASPEPARPVLQPDGVRVAGS
jgi:peptidoglycan/LPS O-acetylase OafA/YrhL